VPWDRGQDRGALLAVHEVIFLLGLRRVRGRGRENCGGSRSADLEATRMAPPSPGKIIIFSGGDFCEISEKLLIHFRGGHPNRVQGRVRSALVGWLPLSRQIGQFNESLLPSVKGAYCRHQRGQANAVAVSSRFCVCIHDILVPAAVVSTDR
jgi:hypothetical protein